MIRKRLEVLERQIVISSGHWEPTLAQWQQDYKDGLTIDEREARDIAAWPGDEAAIRAHYGGMRRRLEEVEAL